MAKKQSRYAQAFAVELEKEIEAQKEVIGYLKNAVTYIMAKENKKGYVHDILWIKVFSEIINGMMEVRLKEFANNETLAVMQDRNKH
jgi:hypothetical protein